MYKRQIYDGPMIQYSEATLDAMPLTKLSTKVEQTEADVEINKGVGREVEFKGLRAQYLFIFAAGLLAVFVMFVIMYMGYSD